MKKSRYIEDPSLNRLTIEELVKSGIWRTRKDKRYKYQWLSEMDQRHLENVINTFMETTNHIVLGALYKELERRTNLANEQKQKIIQIKNKMTNDTMTNETQLELTNIVDTAVTKVATEAALQINSANKSKNPLDRIINPYPQKFKQGETVENKYFIVSVDSRNRRGYTYVVKDTSTDVTREISQSSFLKMLNYPAAKINKKQTKKETKPVAEKPLVNPSIQKYNIGDTVGKVKILKCIRGRTGRGGWAYIVENTETGEKRRVKQSTMCGEHIPANKSSSPFFKDDASPANVASEPKKNSSLLHRLKAAWNVLTQ